jgi:hypothetical protein
MKTARRILIYALSISLIIVWFNAHWSISLFLTLLYISVVDEASVNNKIINELNNKIK